MSERLDVAGPEECDLNHLIIERDVACAPIGFCIACDARHRTGRLPQLGSWRIRTFTRTRRLP